MRVWKAFAILSIFLAAGTGYALEPDQILIIANSDALASVRIAQYYCAKRAVPSSNILALPLGVTLNDTISRFDYEKKLAEPIRRKLASPEFAGKIRCLLTTYGVPVRVEGRGVLKGEEEKLQQLKKLVEQEKVQLEYLEQAGSTMLIQQKKNVAGKLVQLQSDIDLIVGKETNASVDSELSMVLFGNYELYRWQTNRLRYKMPYWDYKSLMVCRLDGPGENIAIGLVDKALAAEKKGLRGIAYVDWGYSEKNKNPLFVHYDQSLRDLAFTIRTQTQIPVVEERTSGLFAEGQCRSAILYCGWYSLKKYVDSFDFVDGAIGYHIASWEAVNLRDPNSSQWCPAMLLDGITATLGAVDEPYLQAFPEPKSFFTELFDGYCLVEAFYRTKPYNSWQLILIGDPLYKPFRITAWSSLRKASAK